MSSAPTYYPGPTPVGAHYPNHTAYGPVPNVMYYVPANPGTDAYYGQQKKSRGFWKTLAIGVGVTAASLLGLKYIKPNWYHTITTEVKKFLPDSLEKAFSTTGFIGKGIEAIKKPFTGDGIFSGVTRFIQTILSPIKNFFNKGI